MKTERRSIMWPALSWKMGNKPKVAHRFARRPPPGSVPDGNTLGGRHRGQYPIATPTCACTFAVEFGSSGVVTLQNCLAAAQASLSFRFPRYQSIAATGFMRCAVASKVGTCERSQVMAPGALVPVAHAAGH